MIKSDLISIILTLYNKAPYIEETIFSIYKQTYTNWELIIVDDCSTDWSFEIAKSFCEKLWIMNKCKFIKNEKNLRVAKTFERWLKEAKWDWISMCDWDDILMKNKLEENLSFCTKNNIDFCHGDMVVIDENSNITNISRINSSSTNPKNKTYKKLIYYWNATWSSIFFSKKIGDGLKKDWFSSFLYQDRWAILYSSIKNYNIEYIKIPLAYYRRCKSCITRDNDYKEKTNKTILSIYKENMLWENERLEYIISKNICINNKQKNRCKKRFYINNLLLKFINEKKLFIWREAPQKVIFLWDIKYYYRVFIIQIRKVLTYFIK